MLPLPLTRKLNSEGRLAPPLPGLLGAEHPLLPPPGCGRSAAGQHTRTQPCHT
jgi:hypothetical protein